jgi:Cupin domain
MATPARRVVTGHNDSGHSIFIMDGPAPIAESGRHGSHVTELWETDATPASNEGAADPTLHPRRLPPPPNGSVFRIVEYAPDSMRRQADNTHASAARDAALYNPNARHFGFHRTNTVDYAIVLSGEIYALMDEGELLLKTGDTLIQRGTSHAWSNRSDTPARVAFVLIDAAPLPDAP